ncbi:MAG: DUF58 domain-containing protein [Planctomycetota bacterium]
MDPKVLNKISRLELRARLVVEGFLSGRHRSPYHGVSVEFAEHREYVPGDDLRHLDWKVFGKTDRYYIKRYEEETSLTCQIVVDGSASMQYAGERGVSKFDYAATAASALAYLILRQQDFVGLALFDEKVRSFVPPSNNPAHLLAITHELSGASDQPKTDIGMVLAEIATRIRQRGMVILISDLFDDPEKILQGLKKLRAKQMDIVVFHVLDDEEIHFPLQRMYRFEGMESALRLTADPRALRAEYLKIFETFTDTMRRGCLRQGIDYSLVNTSHLLDVVLTAFLATRAGGIAGRRKGRG